MNVLGGCGVCSSLMTELNRHTHHIIPTALGGYDVPENRIDICSECHGIIHNAALRMLSKKANPTVIVDSIRMHYKHDAKAINLCLDLVKRVRDEMIVAREKGLDPNSVVELYTTLRRKHKDIVRFFCRDRQISLEDYLRGLIVKDLLHRYGVNQVEERQLLKALRKKTPSK